MRSEIPAKNPKKRRACARRTALLACGQARPCCNVRDARAHDDGRVQWVEVCYCATPLAEEREYWEEYFHLDRVQDAHARSRCKDLNGTEPWSCSDCDCSARLEARLATKGRPFLDTLRTKR